ncbi:RHS repeat-associated core domain-containing protein [Stenotrophomonas sp.]|uniref:RHS repeat-associated core domain-containing protein n=1 Tax=Stenotrophomonas sp. TaxID=69392 RepID=UPI0028A9DAD8|nr:RHS repeat-associated core domain-containing protein [Stenotrophomonas sp.]
MKLLCFVALSAALFFGSFLMQEGRIIGARPAAPLGVADTAPFPTRLVASREPTEADRLALSRFLEQYQSASRLEALSLVEAYLATTPESPWRLALQLNLGELYYQAGYFGKAIETFDLARQVDASSLSPTTLPLRDAALGELARMHARLGHADALDALLKEVGDRPMRGSASEAIAGAREGLHQMRHNPAVAYTCGPAALASLVVAAREGLGTASPSLAGVTDDSLSRIRNYPSGENGIRMEEVLALADAAGMGLVAVRRPAGAPLPLPAVVHWKVDHYAAVVAKQDGLYHVIDPTFGRDLWITQDALDSESSGLFMILKEAAAGWVTASAQELRATMGRGYVTSFDQNDTRSDSVLEEPQSCPRGMCVPNIVSMVNSLRLSDVPVGYAPAVGPDVFTRITYNQREASQPPAFSYANLGPKWSMNWISYIEDDPGSVGTSTRRIDGGGGSVVYDGYYSSQRTYRREQRTGAQLVRVTLNPAVYERRLRDGGKEVFSASNGATNYPRRIFLTKIIDPQGNALDLTYDANMRLSSVTDAFAKVTTFHYLHAVDPFLVTGITDPFGRSAAFAYDGQGRLESITDTIGITSSFGYDAGTTITSLQTPYGTTSFASGTTATQRWLEITDPLGGTRRSEFIAETPGYPQTEPVPFGAEGFQNLQYRNTHYWDAEAWDKHPGDYQKSSVKHWLHGTPTTVLAGVLDSIKQPLESRVWFMHQGQGQPGFHTGTSFDTPRIAARVLPGSESQIFRRAYNPAGNVSEEVDPMGRKIQYDTFGALLNPRVVRTVVNNQYVQLAAYTYNAMNRPLTHVDTAGQTWKMAWNARGQLTTLTNPNGEVTTRIYNALGQMTSILGPASEILYSASYDSVGRVAAETDSGGHTRAFTYDNLDRLVTTTFPDGTTEVNTWTAMDVTAVKDRMNRVTTFKYNANRMLVEKTESGGLVSKYEYDLANRLTAFTDPRGVKTRWDRDVQGRVTAEIFPDDTRKTFTYDIAGRIDRVTDVLGQARQYTYAKDDRITGITYPGALQTTPAVNFVWDAQRPRLLSMTDGVGTTTYSYHLEGTLGGGKLASEASSLGPASTLTYFYDALGRLDARAIGASDELYEYDALGRIRQIDNDLGTHVQSYLGSTGQLAQSIVGSIQTSYSYESNLQDRQLAAITTTSSAGFSSARGYQRDVLGRITAASETRQVTPATTTLRDYGFSYDAHDRLAAWTDTSGSSLLESFDYDDSGNLLQQVRGGTTWNAVANGDNQLVQADGNAWEYDLVGNLINDGKRAYLWDAESRLIKITNITTGATSEFSYDGLGRRVMSTERASSAAPPVTSYYLWCGSEICQKRDSNQSVTATYLGQGEIHGSTLLYYVRDQLGSPREVLNQLGNSMGTLEYGSYGRTVSASGVLPDKRYAGMYYHKESGLYLTWYRSYEPMAGRWISRDPIGLSGGENIYAYVGGDPISFIDPLGLDSIVTYQNIGVTVYFDESGNVIKSWDSLSATAGNAKPGAGGPYRSNDSYPTNGPYKNNARAYGPNDILRTDDLRGRWIHGGGSRLADPLAPRQGWTPAVGCTRMQNEDIQELVDMVRAAKARNPLKPVPYQRMNYELPVIVPFF